MEDESAIKVLDSAKMMSNEITKKQQVKRKTARNVWILTFPFVSGL